MQLLFAPLPGTAALPGPFSSSVPICEDFRHRRFVNAVDFDRRRERGDHPRRFRVAESARTGDDVECAKRGLPPSPDIKARRSSPPGASHLVRGRASQFALRSGWSPPAYGVRRHMDRGRERYRGTAASPAPCRSRPRATGRSRRRVPVVVADADARHDLVGNVSHVPKGRRRRQRLAPHPGSRNGAVSPVRNR